MANPNTPQTEPQLHYVLCTNPKGWHRMAYWQWGAADNDDILLCMHGLTRNGRDFDAVAQHFSDRYRVICPDMVGRGQSDWLGDPDHYNFAQYVGDVATLMAQLQPGRISWLGTSMGGLISLSYIYMLTQSAQSPPMPAPTNVVAPDWLQNKTLPIDRLILNDIGPELALEGLKNIASYVDDVPQLDSFEAALDYARTHWGSFGLETEAQWQAYTQHYFVPGPDNSWQAHYDPAIITAFVRGLDYPMEESQKFLWSLYQQLSIPTLVLRGAHSDLLSPTVYERMLAEQPLAQGWVSERSGHAPSLLFADEVKAIDDFLNS